LTNPGSTTCRPVPIIEASRRGELGDDAVALHDRAVVFLRIRFFLHTTTRSASTSLRRWDG
jgi:hypothetical protein